MTANLALDYTKVARPVTAEEIYADIQCIQMESYRTPDKVIMWEHQFDWIAKKIVPKKMTPEWILVDAQTDEKGLLVSARKPDGYEGATLWGIPVEVREP